MQPQMKRSYNLQGFVSGLTHLVLFGNSMRGVATLQTVSFSLVCHQKIRQSSDCNLFNAEHHT